MSLRSTPSTVLATTTDTYAMEAERLRLAATSGGLTDEDFARLERVHASMAKLEGQRAEALLVLLGAKLNVRDMSPEQLATLAHAITDGKEIGS